MSKGVSKGNNVGTLDDRDSDPFGLRRQGHLGLRAADAVKLLRNSEGSMRIEFLPGVRMLKVNGG